MFNSLRNAMSMPGGDAGALRTRQHSPPEESHNPSLTNAETIGDEEATECKLEDEGPCKHRMLLTFAETRLEAQETRIEDLSARIAELKKQLVTTYERAEAEKKRADKAEEAGFLADPNELRAARQPALQATGEKDAALLKLKKSEQDAKQAREESECLREGLKTIRAVNEKLVLELEEVRNARPSANQTAVHRLHTTITAREAKIEQLVEMYDKLTAEHFATLKQMNKDGEETVTLRAKCENQTVELKGLKARLAKAETTHNW